MAIRLNLSASLMFNSLPIEEEILPSDLHSFLFLVS